MNASEYYRLLVETSQNGGFPSVGPDSKSRLGFSCRYRANDGKRCAVGLAIPDEIYDHRIENGGVGSVVSKLGESWIPNGVCEDDLYIIQDAHDSLANLDGRWSHEDFVRMLKNVPCFKNLVEAPNAPIFS